MQTLLLSYTSHKGAKAIYLEDNQGNNFIVCPLELSNALRHHDEPNRLNLCQLSYEGNLIADTVMDIRPQGTMMMINIRSTSQLMSHKYILSCQQFLSMAQTALHVLALTTLGTRRSDNALAMAI